MSSIIWGMLGGVIAWGATAIFGQPLYRFIGLRADAAKLLARYDRLDYENPDEEEFNHGHDLDWVDARKRSLQARQRDYEDCGASLVGFAIANVVVAKLLRHHLLGKWKFYPKSAGHNFILLGDLRPGAQITQEYREKIISALKLEL